MKFHTFRQLFFASIAAVSLASVASCGGSPAPAPAPEPTPQAPASPAPAMQPPAATAGWTVQDMRTPESV